LRAVHGPAVALPRPAGMGGAPRHPAPPPPGPDGGVMGRRPLVVALGVAVLGLGGVAFARVRGPGRPAGSGGDAGPPNVLVVVTDDARAETLQVMPRTRRWLADGGGPFPPGFAPPPELGARLDQETTLARYLSGGGYRTAMAGKFLNRWPLRRPPPHFDRYAQANGGYYDQLWQVEGAVRRVPTYSTTFIGDQALAYLAEFERDDARPWFLYLAPFA